MLTVLVLASLEKLINFALHSDPITQAGLAPLSGKVLRFTMQVPAFSLDIIFADDHLRLEPVTTVRDSLFEPQGWAGYARTKYRQAQATFSHSSPDCTVKVDNIAELLKLLRAPEGNLPIEGDYKVLMQFKQLMAGFDPDIAGKLEPLIGVPLASQLGSLINHLKGTMTSTAKQTFNDVADWVDEVSGNAAPDPEEAAKVSELKQQLLKLRADIEREETRLAMIKAEQARLKGSR